MRRRTCAVVVAVVLALVLPSTATATPSESKITAVDAAPGALFGQAVALDQTTAIVGAPGRLAAYLFELVGGDWVPGASLTSPDPAPGDAYGASVALSGDTLVVGAPGDDHAGTDAGAAYVWARSDGVWTMQAKLVPTGFSNGDAFGASVAVSDGTVVVGSPNDDDRGLNAGAAFVYVRVVSWVTQAKLTGPTRPDAFRDQLGSAVAISRNTAVLGGPGYDANGSLPGAGLAFIAERSGTTWSYNGTVAGVASDQAVGRRVTIDGTTMAVAGTRAVRVLVRDASAWTDEGTVTPAGLVDALDVDLDTLVVTSAAGAGAGHVFTRESVVWTERDMLAASDGVAGDALGDGSVAVLGTLVLLGAPGDDDAGASSGSAYVFDLAGDPDTDDDGLTNGEEAVLGTDPHDPDTDDDGVLDGAEVAGGTNPLHADSDDDLLSDGSELSRGTDPLDADSDDDGVVDGRDVDWIRAAITALGDGAFQAVGSRAAFHAELDAIDRKVRNNAFDKALHKLANLRSHLDGCGAAPDSGDWIVRCGAQSRIRALVDELVANLS